MLRASTNHAGPSSSVLQIVVARKLTKGSGPARRGGGGKAKFWGDRGGGGNGCQELSIRPPRVRSCASKTEEKKKMRMRRSKEGSM
jgi:hypothetical protein